MFLGVHRPPGVRQSPGGINRVLLTTAAALTPRATGVGLVTVAVLAAVLLETVPGVAGPNGGTVVGGSASIQGQGSASVTINQASQNAIINWQTFNIGRGETTTFNQPNSTTTALNRVIGGQGPSFLDGTLTANGRVFIVNGDGILFGAHSSINTAGFLATTNDIRNEDFMAGKYNFNIPGLPNASIVNLGSITATSGGFAALVAPGVRNAGTITATLGTVSLAAGNAFTLDFYGDRLITLAVNDQIADAVTDVQTGQTLKSLVSNSGKLSANGGRVELTAAAARAVVDSVINNTGVIEANSIGTKNGRIVLSAATGARKPVGAPTQVVKVSGQISAAGKDKGTKGGTVVVTGENIVLAGARIDASGDAGGGRVLIGGDTGGGHPSAAAANIELAKLETFVIPTATTVSVDAASTINASATGNGNGGKVVLWSDQQTTFAGTILARGGAGGGDGGFVETSSHQQLDFRGTVDLRAPLGSVGTLLLDPADFYIVTTLGGSPTGASEMTNVALQNQLALGDVTITTSMATNPTGQNGDIFVYSDINWSSNSTLTLSAYRNINIEPGITISNATVGNGAVPTGNLVLRADNTGTGTGTVQFFGGTNQINFSGSAGATSIYYDPTCEFYCNKYRNSSDSYFAQHVIGELTVYMLINNASDLQLIGANLGAYNVITGNYALGKSFSAAPNDGFGYGFGNGTSFNGLLDGNGGLGVNYTISNLTLETPSEAEGFSYGLFPYIGSSGIVRNLNLAGVSVVANRNVMDIGTLAGVNAGTISNVAVLSGTVDGSSFTGIDAGGLVGQNNAGGTITRSSAAVAVTVGDATFQSNYAGGLVANNLGAITKSSATGNVSGGLLSYVGGLVGQNGVVGEGGGAGTIGASFATGTVTTGDVGGGLVGTNSLGSVAQSYATGAVSGSGIIGGLVGLNSANAGVTQSYATGSVMGTAGSPATVGGLVGGNYGSVSQSYATGPVTGAAEVGSIVGGLVGYNSGSVTVSYWDATTVGPPGTPGLGGSGGGAFSASGLTTAQFQAGLPSGFDPTAWGTNAVINNGLPILLWQGPTVNIITVDANPETKVYGNIDPTFTFTVVSGNLGSATFSGALTRASGENVGSYDISEGTLSLPVGYQINFVDSDLAITQRPITVTANAQTAIYGSTIPPLTYVVGGSGLVNGDTLTGSLATTATTISNVGQYAIRQGTLAATSNYTLTYVGANLSITRAPLTVTANAQSMTYGNAPPSLGYAVTGLVNGDTLTGSLATTANATSNVGQYQITEGTLAATANYTLTYEGANLVVTARPLTVTANEQNVTYGSAIPPLTYVVGGSGLVNGDTLTGSLVTTATSTSNVGQYPIAQGTLAASSNYALSYVGANLTIQTQNQLWMQSELIQNLTGGLTLASLTSGEIVNTQALNRSPPPRPGAGAPSGLPPQFGARFFTPPPPGETHYISDEVVLQIPTNIPTDQLRAMLRRLGLYVLGTQNLDLLGVTTYRVRIGNGSTIASVIKALAAFQIVAGAQANYTYSLVQSGAPAASAPELAQDPDLAGRTQEGDAAQYSLSKLGLIDVHRLTKGTNVTVAVIDSEIDVDHPDLKGAILEQFDAVGANDMPHSHGTGMAGAIAAHQRLMGIAPSAGIYAIHAFSSGAASAESTTFNILKGLDWATAKGARVINMSFAGPRDPSMERALRVAHDKGIVLIAAAGNAGPKSPPLYPAADPNVIAVTATDVDDKIFSGANRGRYIAVAAPGVDILVPAPEGTYQLSTGTSVASAEVSGVAALMIERNPDLRPEDVRRILTASARRLSAKDRDDDFGSGLVDPAKAIQTAGELSLPNVATGSISTRPGDDRKRSR